MENKIIYLDNAATTKPCREAVEAMCLAAEIFGNPSSLHKMGLESEKLVEAARQKVAERLGVESKKLFFTSGGTEANNMAIFGTARAKKKLGTHIITTKIEHPSVLESFKELENEGFEVTYLNVDSECRINLEEFENALTEKTTLVSVMHVNNETGVIQPVDKLKAIMKRKSPRAVLHCDCVQSFGKIETKPKKWGADLVTVSAHKIHGFKGCGALYIADGRIKPIIYGGEQQMRIRPGTENVGGILAFGAAAEAYKAENLSYMRETLKNKLIKRIDNIKINGSDEFNAGSVLNVSFIGIKAEILLHALGMHGIYVSTGSACSTHKPQPSHVLTAMGLDKKEIEGAIRISFDDMLSDEELEMAAAVIEKEAASIRR